MQVLNSKATLIPKGMYCYTIESIDEKTGRMKVRNCPFWSFNPKKDSQNHGYCGFIDKGDWEIGGLLWDQVKECGENMGYEEEEL